MHWVEVIHLIKFICILITLERALCQFHNVIIINPLHYAKHGLSQSTLQNPVCCFSHPVAAGPITQVVPAFVSLLHSNSLLTVSQHCDSVMETIELITNKPSREKPKKFQNFWSWCDNIYSRVSPNTTQQQPALDKWNEMDRIEITWDVASSAVAFAITRHPAWNEWPCVESLTSSNNLFL